MRVRVNQPGVGRLVGRWGETGGLGRLGDWGGGVGDGREMGRSRRTIHTVQTDFCRLTKR